MGHSAMTISFVIFMGKTIDVCFARSDRNIGGRNMDHIMMQDICKKYMKTAGDMFKDK